jgi:Flp pilus assembly protein TadG
MIFHPRRNLGTNICQNTCGKWRRHGTAAVEFAVLAPFLFALVVGMVEMARAINMKDMLSNAARKGCNTGVSVNKTYSNITSDINDILSDHGIDPTKATITVQVATYTGGTTTPSWGSFTTVTAGAYAPQILDQVQVKVSIPVTAVLWFAPQYFSQSSLESESVVMVRQG